MSQQLVAFFFFGLSSMQQTLGGSSDVIDSILPNPNSITSSLEGSLDDESLDGSLEKLEGYGGIVDDYSSEIMHHNLSEYHFHSRYCPNNEDEIIPAPMLNIDSECQCEYFHPASLTLDKNLIECDIEDVIEIKNLVNKHGVLILNNVNLEDDEELLNFTLKFGEMIQLPGVFTKQSHASDYVAVITNIFENGTVDDKDTTAGYWHNDGDFWQNNYLYNFLFSRIVPQTNGETGFLDLRLAYKHLACHHRNLFNDLAKQKVCVKSEEIPDFQKANFSVPAAYHYILDKHVVTGESIVYYGHRNAQIYGLNNEKSEELLHGLESIISDVDEFKYLHKWQRNQMLIWDNTLVMHRAMGNVGSQPRLLLRTQAKIDLIDEF